jgi:hypothetical protein
MIGIGEVNFQTNSLRLTACVSRTLLDVVRNLDHVCMIGPLTSLIGNFLACNPSKNHEYLKFWPTAGVFEIRQKLGLQYVWKKAKF